MDEGSQLLPLPPALDPEPISRPSSTSTQASAAQNIQQSALPGIAALATASQAANSTQPRPVPIAPAMYPQGTSPASTHPGPGGNLPTCQNCQTSTTPLWRRDEMGAVLCNACGLFLKLHGRPRPISLKTDVIKSRNRVKTMRPDLAKQKKQNQGLTPADMNGADYANSANGAAAANARRASQRSVNGTHDDTNSPVSRTGTPNMYAAHPLYPNIDEQFQAPHLPNFGVAGASPGRAPSPLNGQLSRTEELLNENSTLKTRVSELEVIQELYRGRIQQLEQEETVRQQNPDAVKTEEQQQLHSQVAALTESNLQLQKSYEDSQKQLEESHRRENMLKRRLDELEIELKNTKESLETYENNRAKKPRLDDGTTEASPESPSETKTETAP